MSYYKIGGLGQSVRQVIELFPGGGIGYLTGNAQIIHYKIGDEIKHVTKISESEFKSLLEQWRVSVNKDQANENDTEEIFKPLTKYFLDSPDMQIEGYSTRDRNALCNFFMKMRDKGFVVLDEHGAALGFVNANIAKEASYIFEDVE